MVVYERRRAKQINAVIWLSVANNLISGIENGAILLVVRLSLDQYKNAFKSDSFIQSIDRKKWVDTNKYKTKNKERKKERRKKKKKNKNRPNPRKKEDNIETQKERKWETKTQIKH